MRKIEKKKTIFRRKDMRKCISAQSSSNLRIGQLMKKKDFEDFEDDDDAGSAEWSEGPAVSPDAPWYLKGAQVKVIDFVYLSERDESTASEGDVLGDTDDDFSVIDDSEMEISSSSSSNEEDDVKKEDDDDSDDDEEEEEVVSQSTTSVVGGILKNRDDVSSGTPSSKSDISSNNPSDTMSNVGYTAESTKMIVNKKLAVSLEELREAELNYRRQHGFKSLVGDEALVWDEDRAKEIREQILGQKVALYEKDMSDYLTGKRKEDAMRDTIRGASYWRIRKTLKVLKMADPFSTHLALTMLVESELDNPENHAAIDDTGSVELLVNLLNVEWSNCRIGALTVLDIITEANEEMGEISMNLGMVEEIYRILLSNDDEEVLLGTRCLCNLMYTRRSRTVFRKAALIPILFSLVHRVPMKLLRCKLSEVFDPLMHRKYEIAMGSLYMLTAIMRSRQIREELFECGYLSIVNPLLGSRERLIVKAVLEGILLCASLRKYRQRFEISGIIKLVLKHWKKHEEIVLRFVYKMSIGVVGREQIIETDALSKVVSFVMCVENMRKDPYGFKYALACIHRVGAHHQAREYFKKLNLLALIINILKADPPDAYQFNIICILAQLSIFPENWKPIVEFGGLQCVLNIIFTRITNLWLIANCLKILGDVAYGEDARDLLLENPDTLHYLLSLLNDGRPLITRCAARAIVPMIRVYPDFAEVIKTEGDSLESLVDKLDLSPYQAEDSHVKSAVCDALAAITCDQSILQILRFLNLSKKVSALMHTADEGLQESICLLITSCSISPEVRIEIGELGIVEAVASFIKSPNIHVVIGAVNALWKLSFEPSNATRILNTGIMRKLLEWTLSEYQDMSDAALGVMRNIRFTAATADGIHKTGNTNAVVEPEWFYPYHFKPQVFYHEDIELEPT